MSSSEPSSSKSNLVERQQIVIYRIPHTVRNQIFLVWLYVFKSFSEIHIIYNIIFLPFSTSSILLMYLLYSK